MPGFAAIIIQGRPQYRALIVPQGSPLCAFPGQLTDPVQTVKGELNSAQSIPSIPLYDFEDFQLSSILDLFA